MEVNSIFSASLPDSECGAGWDSSPDPESLVSQKQLWINI